MCRVALIFQVWSLTITVVKLLVIQHSCILFRSCEPSDSSVRTVLVILTLFGFIIFDLAYIATVMNYSCQCHLLTCLVLGLKERILMKAVAVDEAIKVMEPYRKDTMLPSCINSSKVQRDTVNGERFTGLNFYGFQEYRECFPVKITSFV